MSTERMGGMGVVLEHELFRADAAGADGRQVVLVEGASDQRAVETLAHRHGRDLDLEGSTVIAIAGATNLNRFLDLLGPSGHDVSLVGLCDAGEERLFRNSLRLSGIANAQTRAEMERLGFFVCVRDLEDELIRALGSDAMLELMESQGDLRRFHSFQNQPAQRLKTIEAQIWRWLGNHKIAYAPLMVEALDLDRVPAPLHSLLEVV